MSLDSKLLKIKSIALAKIEEAAKTGDTESIIANSKIIEEIERLAKKTKEIIISVEFLEKKMNTDLNLEISKNNFEPEISIPNGDIFTSRQRGKQKREFFIKKLREKNIQLNPFSGETIFSDEKGKIIGIAFATERQPNKWFLGLPERDYDAITLLCERENGVVLNFVFPRDFCIKYKDNFSKSKGQMKFNVVNRHGSFLLLLSGVMNPDITKFVDYYETLK